MPRGRGLARRRPAEEGRGDAQSPREGALGQAGPEQAASAGARERILDAAKQLFASRGFDATPTKEIASQAGVPSGLVFYYFPAKRGLLLSIIKERGFLPELRAMVQAGAQPRENPRDELTALGLRIVDFSDRHQDLMRILVHEAISHPEVEAELRALIGEGNRLIAAYLRGEVDAGRLEPMDVDVVARLFVAGILIGVVDRPTDPREQVRPIVETLLRGPDSASRHSPEVC